MGAYLPWGACGLGEVFLLDWGEARPPISPKGGQENDRFPGRSTQGAAFADLPAGAGVRQAGRRTLFRNHANHQCQRMGWTSAGRCEHCARSKINSHESANRPGPHLPRSAPDSQRRRRGTGRLGISAIRSGLLALLSRGQRLRPARCREIPSPAPLSVARSISVICSPKLETFGCKLACVQIIHFSYKPSMGTRCFDDAPLRMRALCGER